VLRGVYPSASARSRQQKRPSLAAMHNVEQFVVQLGTQGVFAQVGDGGGVVDDRRGDGRARLRDQFSERFPAEASKYEG